MLEQRRQNYLSLLGIDNYVPRRLLDNAAESELLTDEHFAFTDSIASVPTHIGNNNAITTKQEPNELLHTQQDTQRQTESPAAALTALETLRGASDAETTAPKQNSPSSLADILEPKQTADAQARSEHSAEQGENKISSANEGSTAEELDFVLSVWRIRDQLLVIDTRQPGAAYPTDRLLQNMLRAIGYPLAQLPASETIRWPLFINKKQINKNANSNAEKHSQDVEQARAMVQAYITAQMAKLPFNALLCMGDEAARFSLDGSDSNTADEKDNQWNIPVVKTPSLFSMLQEPLLKASAWKALQAIIKKDDT